MITGMIVLPAQVYVTNGDASALSDSCFQLTPAQNWQGGSVWFQNRINLAADFELEAEINLGIKDGNGADGLAFVLQPNCNGIGSFRRGHWLHEYFPFISSGI